MRQAADRKRDRALEEANLHAEALRIIKWNNNIINNKIMCVYKKKINIKKAAPKGEAMECGTKV